MLTWQRLKVEGLGPVARFAAVFQIGPPLAWLPFASFKMKVLERGDGSFLAVPNVCVRSPDGSPGWTSGLGSTAEDALNHFVQSLNARRDLPEDSFMWSDPEERIGIRGQLLNLLRRYGSQHWTKNRHCGRVDLMRNDG